MGDQEHLEQLLNQLLARAQDGIRSIDPLVAIYNRILGTIAKITIKTVEIASELKLTLVKIGDEAVLKTAERSGARQFKASFARLHGLLSSYYELIEEVKTEFANDPMTIEICRKIAFTILKMNLEKTYKMTLVCYSDGQIAVEALSSATIVVQAEFSER